MRHIPETAAESQELEIVNQTEQSGILTFINKYRFITTFKFGINLEIGGQIINNFAAEF